MQTSSVSFEVDGTGGIIIQPPANQQYQLNGGNPITTTDPGEATIPLEGANLPGQSVSWSATLDYTDSGKHKATTVPISIDPTAANTEVQWVSPAGEGGLLTLNATVGSYSEPVTVYITGTDIDENNLTGYLDGLVANESLACTAFGVPWACCTGSGTGTCTPATPNLFELLATEETSVDGNPLYEEFAQLVAEEGDPNGAPYGIDVLWPLENGVKKGSALTGWGKYIGLFQDGFGIGTSPYAQQNMTAFNWVQNSQDGVAIYNGKVSSAITFQDKFGPSTYPNLPALAQSQVEDIALGEYGGFASNAYGGKSQYWYPCGNGKLSSCPSGSWHWCPNKFTTKKAKATVTYVDKVRQLDGPPACN